jgi:hypothetical protein
MYTRYILGHRESRVKDNGYFYAMGAIHHLLHLRSLAHLFIHSSENPLFKRNKEQEKEPALLALVLKCYELRIRQHKNRLMVNALRPSNHYFSKDITIFGRRSRMTYLHHHNMYQ